jgi:hypothetical protein
MTDTLRDRAILSGLYFSMIYTAFDIILAKLYLRQA